MCDDEFMAPRLDAGEPVRVGTTTEREEGNADRGRDHECHHRF